MRNLVGGVKTPPNEVINNHLPFPRVNLISIFHFSMLN